MSLLPPPITLDDSVRRAAPGLSLGCLRARVVVRSAAPALEAALTAAGHEALARLPEAGIAAVPGIAATRTAYKALGKDPARYRASSEALFRRVHQGKGLYRVNTVVDVNNLVSLHSGLPIGAYDLARIEGPVTFRRAGAGETYRGIGRGPLNLEGLPVFADSLGPFGSPTSDSERTMVGEETREILMVLIAFAGEVEGPLADAVAALTEHAEATALGTAIVQA